MTDEIPTWDKFNHLFAFVTLAFLTDHSFPGLKYEWIKWISLAAYGLGLEILQWFTDYRYWEFNDLITDILGIAAYVLFRKLINYYRFKTNV